MIDDLSNLLRAWRGVTDADAESLIGISIGLVIGAAVIKVLIMAIERIFDDA